LNKYKSKLSITNKIARLTWIVIWFLFAKPFPGRIFNSWKLFLLGLFGSKVNRSSVVYSNAIIYQPWKLTLGYNSCIASNANIYNVDNVIIGDHVTISQGAYICTASHDYTSLNFELVTKPIIIKDSAWVAAEAFVNLGVTVGEGAIVAARSYVYKNVDPWTIVGGNPARFIKERILNK
jgi:putative colanic acid biosynthesis acetyltransferase WcaF